MNDPSPWALKRALIGEICARGDLSPSELRVAVVLLNNHHNVATGRCNPGLGALIKGTSLCRAAVLSAIKKLEAKEIVRRTTGGGTTTNSYQFPGLDRSVDVDRSTGEDRSTFVEETGPPLWTPPVHGSGRDRSTPVDPNKEENKEKNKELNTRRVTRLPPDWKPSEVDRGYAKGKGLSEAAIDLEVEKIINWSANNLGKSNWSAAWRNWVLGTIERLQKDRRQDPREGGRDAGSYRRPTKGIASALAGIDRFYEEGD